jgi:hypothetical protein
MRRREFVQCLGAGGILASLSSGVREAWAAAANTADLTIAEVEILRLSGPRTVTRGPTGQYQVNPLHLYADRRPQPFKESPAREET